MTATPVSKQISLFHTSDTLCKYLVLIPLPEEISKDVVEMKQAFRKEFGPYPSEFSVPHITVCSFLLLNTRSSEVFSLFQQSLKNISQFTLTIDGFSGFENNVIYLQPRGSAPFSSITRQFDLCRKELRIRKNYISSDIPHITIARGLAKETFQKAKQVWFKKLYYATFKVNELTVLSFDFEENRYRKHSSLYLGSS